jgi:hypothetical protein
MSIKDVPTLPERWDSTDVFVAACKAFNVINECKALHNQPQLGVTLVDINDFQDMLIKQGYAIKKIKQ